MSAVEAHALAKINLHLAVHARRADGFHELTTVFQSIALHDTLRVEACDGPFELRCATPGVPTDHTNLVWRAAAAVADVLGRSLAGLRVTLDKRVPAESGLGGGSADAMAMLRALAQLWQAPLDARLLAAVGRLGSDVPFFALGGTALGLGRGDELEPLADLPEHSLVIVRPSFGVGTADAYRWVAESRAGRSPAMVDPSASARLDERAAAGWPQTSEAWPARLRGCANDFEPVVASRFDEIPAIAAGLRQRGAALALLSGSGSAVVGLFEDAAAADGAAAALSGRPGLRCWLSRTVSRAAYAAAVAPVVRP
jgi:4-diphosphocytidyl-2-C-methyl-D-erythritol kinase